MELNITNILKQGDALKYLSGSAYELGDNAGTVTWGNCLASELLTLTNEQVEKLRDYFACFGAWTEEELSKFSHKEITALTLQDIASQCREFLEEYESEEEYRRAAEVGTARGMIYSHEGEYYIYLES